MTRGIVEAVTRHLLGPWRYQREWVDPIYITRGEGVYLYGSDGERYLDFSSSLACVNLGYGNRRIIEAVKEQVEKLAYLGPSYATEVRAGAAEALASILPRNLSKFMISSSGSEANEDALKIARAFSHPRYKIMARYISYHGNTSGSISLTGDPRRSAVELHTRIDGVVRIPDPYCYRCPFGEDDPEKCGLKCISYIEYILRNEDNIGAIFLETVTGTNGVIVPPRDYFGELDRIRREYGVLLILDEVMSGWCRTGEWFAFMHWGLNPDIFTTGKGATGSYIPIGITVIDVDIASYFNDRFLPLGHTFSYHPLAMAALKASIEEYRDRDIVRRTRILGDYLGRRLHELMDRHRSIGDVRGIGLFWAIELVKDRVSRKPFNTRMDKITGRTLMTVRVAREMARNGVLVDLAWISTIIIAPPLIINEDEIDYGIEVLDKALNIADREAS